MFYKGIALNEVSEKIVIQKKTRKNCKNKGRIRSNEKKDCHVEVTVSGNDEEFIFVAASIRNAVRVHNSISDRKISFDIIRGI